MTPTPHVSCKIGLGCVTFGREIDQATAFTLMDRAWERGVRYFDSAAAYGDGASERVVGAWFASRRQTLGANPPLVGTKILPPYTASRIRDSVTESRARLEKTHLHLLFLHRWDPTAETEEVLCALDQLVRAGEVNQVGVSNVTAPQLSALVALQNQIGCIPIRAIQNNHNLAVRDVTGPLKTYCQKHDIAIQTYSPLGAGYLTGKHRQGVVAGSRFEVIPGHQSVYFHPLQEQRLNRLHQIAKQTGIEASQLALAWALHQSAVDTVLVGGRKPEHLEQAFEAQSLDQAEVFCLLEQDSPTN